MNNDLVPVRWTRFMDMHSGGGQKLDWGKIYIEAPEAEARVIFYNRFGRNPDRVTCTCCGEDYSVDDSESLAQASGYDRNCDSTDDGYVERRSTWMDEYALRSFAQLTDPKAKKLVAMARDTSSPNEASNAMNFLYHDFGEQIGYSYERNRYIPLEEFERELKTKDGDDVLIVYAKDIKPEERIGRVPRQGYVWVEE